MAFHITHRYGDMERPESLAAFVELLSELDQDLEDTEHASVSVSHESEWCISVSRGGYVIFEHLENGGERHMRGVSDGKIIDLWTLLAEGEIARIEQEPWLAGYG